MPDFNIQSLIQIIFSVLVYVATWLRNRSQMNKEKQVVYDILQNSGQEEVVRLENVEYRCFDLKKQVEELKSDNAILKALIHRMMEDQTKIVQPKIEIENGIRGNQENRSGY